MRNPQNNAYRQAMQVGFNVNYKTIKCKYFDQGRILLSERYNRQDSANLEQDAIFPMVRPS
jgi:hypothetical protein